MSGTTATNSAAVPVPGVALRSFLQKRRGAGQGLFAVVDAARDRELAHAAQTEFSLPQKTLFADDVPTHMYDVAPYLIDIDAASRAGQTGGEGFLERWAARLGSAAGILVFAEGDLPRLRRHFREVFRASDPTGHQYYFRFYDPRVLRSFLRKATPADARALFGPVASILVESETDGNLLIARPGPEGAEIVESAVEERATRRRRGGRKR